ncbi:MAG TPA: hypothetical protein VFV66_19675 [Nonomuraea sp.]|nr:hypothetical protein [Nonomuraea sp.]
MGRHGTGGSDDGEERGDSAFWGPDEQAEPPGWPSLPDRPDVTGHWAPMPRRENEPPRGPHPGPHYRPHSGPQSEPQPRPQPEPFETSGTYALPTDSAGGRPPASDPAGAFPPPPGPYGDPAGPFETTGAFARPSDWDAPPGQPFPGSNGPDTFGAPGAPGASGAAGHGYGRAPGFDGPGFDGPATGVFDVPGSFERPGGGTGSFDRPPGNAGPFGQPGSGAGPFDRPPGDAGPFDRQGDGFFDQPAGGAFGRETEATARIDRSRFFDGAEDGDGHADRTVRFDKPPGPRPVSSGPPEPGDVKVAGEPTAVQAPAWAEAETGFLASGWSADAGFDAADEPQRRRGRRKPRRRDDGELLAAPSGGGKGRVALLSVAAVAVVLGGTVAGVKFMSGSSGAACEGAACAAVQATTSAPVAEPATEPAEEAAEPEDESLPDDEEEGRTAETPTPTATYVARAPRRTPTPTPTRTKARKSAKPSEPVETPEPTPEEASPTETPTVLDPPSSPPSTVTAEPTGSPTTFGSDAGGGSVNITQTIRQRLASYRVELTLANTSRVTLDRPTVSVPVEGRVTDVDGADWTQDGDLLILDLSASLAAGDTAEVRFTAIGRGVPARTCGMVSGECAVS